MKPNCLNIGKLSMLISLLILTACNSGSTNSNTSQFTPSNNATNVSPNTQISFTFQNPVNPTNINPSTFRLIDEQNMGIVSGRVIPKGDNLTFYFLPNRLLDSNRQYDISINLGAIEFVNNANKQTSSTQYSTFKTSSLPYYNIFVTKGTYKGSLSDYDPATTVNGIAAGDYICNSNSNNPDKNYTYYKAMIAADPDYDYRYACKGNNCGGQYSYDWVLQPNTTYYNSNAAIINTTTQSSIFTFPLKNPFSTYTNQVWTGLSATFAEDDSCTNWTRGINDYHGRSGTGNVKDSQSISKMEQDCDLGFALYCVAQPPVVMLGPTNNEMVGVTNIPIKIMFNSVKNVDSTSVNSSTFTVSTDGVNISGTITASGLEYTFKPSSKLKNNKTYLVKTSGVKDITGAPIHDGEFVFQTTPTPAKLWFVTVDKWYGDLYGIKGADDKCQADSKCPSGKICKAVISDNSKRKACTDLGCGAGYSVDWTLSPNTYYINTLGNIIGSTNDNAIFPFTLGYVLQNPIGTGRVWTGMGGNWISNNDGVCQNWTHGKSGHVDKSGGLLGEGSSTTYTSIGTGTAGSCSEYTYEDPFTFDKYCELEASLEGCSKRHLYCVEI